MHVNLSTCFQSAHAHRYVSARYGYTIFVHTLNALLKKERLAVTEVELFKAVLNGLIVNVQDRV